MIYLVVKELKLLLFLRNNKSTLQSEKYVCSYVGKPYVELVSFGIKRYKRPRSMTSQMHSNST